MWNVTCPRCGKPAFRWMVKVLLGPARSVGCLSCGGEVGVSWVPLAAGVALFVAFVLVGALPDSPFLETRIVVTVFAALVLGWCAWFVQSPLVRKDDQPDDEG